MRFRLYALLAVFLLVGSVAGVQAQNTAEIYGKVTDASGAIMPGVTVTLTSPVLLQPLTAVSTETGTYRFPGLGVGTYTVKFELTGFKTVVKEGYRLELAESAQINQALEISTVQETVTVTGETPLVDLKDTSKTNRFTQEALQSIPSARDPWVIIEQSAGVAMDRQNVGGSASGQQSNFVARGAAMAQQKWNLDGVDVTDMNATGGSPVYYDFDAFEEMQISTGGADVSMQSPGVGVNLVTKSGTDRFRGSGPLLRHRPEVPVEQRHRRAAQERRQYRQPDPEHQGLRVRGRRPAQEGPGLDLGQLRQAEHQRRHQQLLQGRRHLPGHEGEPAELLARGHPGVPEPGHHDPQQLQRQVRVADLPAEPVLVLLERGREGAQRP